MTPFRPFESTLQLRPHGCSLAISPLSQSKFPSSLRSACSGWSRQSARSNSVFLQSVHRSGIRGFGVSITLTVRDCPTADEWRSFRNAFFKRLRRKGLMRCHWLTEWQQRETDTGPQGVPHLHMSAFFSRNINEAEMVDDWLDIAAGFGPKWQGQHVKKIHDLAGWFAYVAKHGARGLKHYQRSKELIPESWATFTGRMWGKFGDWPVQNERFNMSKELFYRLRRDLHKMKNAGYRYARHCSQASSSVLGITDWAESADLMRLIRHYCWDDSRRYRVQFLVPA